MGAVRIRVQTANNIHHNNPLVKDTTPVYQCTVKQKSMFVINKCIFVYVKKIKSEIELLKYRLNAQLR